MSFLDKVGETRVLYYPANDCRIKLERHPDGSLSAIDADNFELGYPVGWGQTQLEAIADLRDQMVARQLWSAGD